ncbi:hypothetical protein K663_00650 [Sphingobium sp. MI1205]|nr:hypothetical protein [Sphingobium sp. MI1205]AMK16523.1 hypothetical protein K663_00650 [Sphingobium sp. MI1205]
MRSGNMASSPLPDARSGLTRDLSVKVSLHPRWLIPAWILCSVILLWLSRGQLTVLGFRDPDDAMRLQQVRDWIGGQPFLDVSQHRVSPPTGGPMHWSRIVDMPIAALILLLHPMVGASMAEVIACSVVPLLLLGCLVWVLHVASDRIAGRPVAMIAPLLLLTTPTILVQYGPLRIDHHGWQILMATIALAGAMDPRPARGGVVAGAAIAIWLQISSEGLPYAALFAAALALRQWLDRRETARFVAYAATLGGAAFLLLALLRGFGPLMQAQCDALSAAYVWPLLAFAVATPIAFHFTPASSARGRFLAAGLSGGAAAALFVVTGRACLTGDPFQALGPVAYKLWYLHVMEGRPIWEQGRSMAGLILIPPVAGLAGSILAARNAAMAQVRDRWLMVALLLTGATIVALLVMRAMSVAHVFALPGIGWLILQLFRRAQQQSATVVRVFASSAVALLTPAALCAIWIAAMAALDKGKDETPTVANDCRTPEALTSLRQLPPSTLFAPLDIGPDILVRTRHKVIGTAHHRNAAGITAVVEGFTAPPAQARTILTALNGGKGPDYLIACAGLNEFRHYSKEHEGSLAAMLDRGKQPEWLKPVALRGAKSLRVYQVRLQQN